MSNWIIDQIIFKCPFTLMIAGPSAAGKTSLLEKIFINKKYIFDKQPDRIVFCYKNNQVVYDVFNLLDISVEFIQRIPDNLVFDPKIINILIIDDLMTECKDNPNVASYFTRRSHHENIRVILVSQNIFMQGKCTKGFMEIFDDAVTVKNGFKFNLYDFKPSTKERMRIQTGIIPGEERIIFI